jgi:MFS family permease
MYSVFIIIGIGFGPSDVVPLSIVVRWFVKRRGIMSGVMKIGTGLGLMVMPLAASILISSFDWRNSYRILGALVLVTVIPFAQFLRRDPHEMGLLPDGKRQPDAGSPILAEEGLSFREAIRTRQLWIVCGVYVMILFSTQSIMVHIVPHAVDLGISQTIAAGIASTIGGTSMLGRLVMGFTGDRIGYKRAMIVCFLILLIAFSWLHVATELWMLYLFAAIYGFNHGGFFALISPLVAALFGTRSQGTLLGVVIFSGTFVGGISPILTGWMFDITGSYQQAFLILLLTAIMGLILTIRIRLVGELGTTEGIS